MTRYRISSEAWLLALGFAIAHTQSPLYYSNQNQYLLHGAALAGRGHLSGDWLATTTDPTPLFSWLIAGLFRLHPVTIQVAYFLILMGYFLTARVLIEIVPGVQDSRARRLVFATLFTAAHAAILRWTSVQVAGVDYPWYLQAGLAAQYMLGPGLQPSAFGVLLLASVAALIRERTLLACALAALACGFHATYLLPAALLVLGFCVAEWVKGQRRRAIRGAGLALILVLPVVVASFRSFNPLDPSNAESQRILATIRIPHHALVARWFDGLAGFQVFWILLAIFLLRKQPTGRVMGIAFAGGTLLTLAIAGREAEFPGVALAFPWRVSVLLVPVATTVIAGRIATWLQLGVRGGIVSGFAFGGLVIGGLAVSIWGLGYRTVAEEEPLFQFIRENSEPNDVYLIPTAYPKVSTGRGAVSNTFAAPPRSKPDTNQIPVDLQRFRLATGARIYVDFKSVPYAADEVFEWRRRMNFAVNAYSGNWSVSSLKGEGITHVVAPANKRPQLDSADVIFEDPAYLVLRLP